MGAMGMAVKLYDDLTMTTMVNLAAKGFYDGIGRFGVDIAADRVGEQGVKGVAMLVVH